MKLFDLTFCGTVLPEHDPQQVKRGIASLFGIVDTVELEEMFSGKMIVLRHNLDRKSAAEYFKKITEMGAKAALVESVEIPTVEASTIAKNADGKQSYRSSAIDGNQTIRDLAPIKHSLARTAHHQKATSQQLLTACGDELDRLRTLTSQLKERSRRRYLALQTRREAFERIAEQESALIEARSQELLAGVQSELVKLQRQEDQLKAKSEEEIGKLERERARITELAQDRVRSLERMKKETRERELALIADIESRRDATRSSAEQEIRRLQQLLEDTQHQAEIDDARLVQELENTRSGAILDIESLEQQRIQALNTQEECIRLLIEKKDEEIRQLEQDIADHKRRQQELHQQCREESSKLNLRLLDIKNRYDCGLAEIEKASGALEDTTRKNLKKLYSMELQAKRRHNEALQHFLEPGLPAVQLPEISSH